MYPVGNVENKYFWMMANAIFCKMKENFSIFYKGTLKTVIYDI